VEASASTCEPSLTRSTTARAFGSRLSGRAEFAFLAKAIGSGIDILQLQSPKRSFDDARPIQRMDVGLKKLNSRGPYRAQQF
jgi:hypothetical protein